MRETRYTAQKVIRDGRMELAYMFGPTNARGIDPRGYDEKERTLVLQQVGFDTNRPIIKEWHCFDLLCRQEIVEEPEVQQRWGDSDE